MLKKKDRPQSVASPAKTEYNPDEYFRYRVQGQDYEVRKASLEEEPLKTYINNMMTWVQNTLYSEGLVVKSISDVSCWIILSVLFKKCKGGQNIPHEILVKTEETVYQLKLLLLEIEKSISYKANINKWSAETIFSKHIPATLHLLTALYMEYCPNVPIIHNKIEITIFYTSQGQRHEMKETIFDMASIYEKMKKDSVFETLISDPDKHKQFVDGITKFVNSHLNPIGRSVTNLTSDFTDGVNLIILCGSVGNFYVPTHAYALKPIVNAERECNIRFAFELFNDLDVSTTYYDVNDILSGNKTTTLKLLYSLFKRYK